MKSNPVNKGLFSKQLWPESSSVRASTSCPSFLHGKVCDNWMGGRRKAEKIYTCKHCAATVLELETLIFDDGDAWDRRVPSTSSCFSKQFLNLESVFLEFNFSGEQVEVAVEETVKRLTVLHWKKINRYRWAKNVWPLIAWRMGGWVDVVCKTWRFLSPYFCVGLSQLHV